MLSKLVVKIKKIRQIQSILKDFIHNGDMAKVAKSKVQKNKESKTTPGALFVGCMFVGLGLGLLFGRPDAGVLLGLGVGFLALWHVRNQK